jgi:flagella basal body P-ring formation protein FlgA
MMIALLLACCLNAPSEVTVDTDTVKLGAIVGFLSGDPRASLPLGAAPQPGLGRSFTRQELIAKVHTAGLPIDDLQLPDSVMVRRKSQGLDSATVAALVQDAFARQYPDADIRIVSIDTPEVGVATGPLEITASLPERPDPSAPIFVVLNVRSAGYSRKVFVKTVAEVRRPQPTLRNDVAANGEIHADDIEWTVLPLHGRGDPLQSSAGLEGMLAKRALPAGEILTGDLLYAPLIVHKGETVTVRATHGAITITAVMRARSSARLGETIVVEHLSSVGFTSARVIGPRLLEATQGAK